MIDPEFDGADATRGGGKCSRFQRRWPLLLGIACLLILAGIALELWASWFPPSWTADYDRPAYARFRDAIGIDRTLLLNTPFDRFSREVGLDEALWDDGLAFQLPGGMYRIYHFRGFALHVLLRELPAGDTPNRVAHPSNTEVDRRCPGVLWFYDTPQIRIDGISGRAERMKQHLQELEAECARINAEMDRMREMRRSDGDGG
jgi:hypothetical protein